MGNFAQMSLPLADSVEMTIQLVNSNEIITVTVSTNTPVSESTDD